VRFALRLATVPPDITFRGKASHPRTSTGEQGGLPVRFAFHPEANAQSFAPRLRSMGEGIHGRCSGVLDVPLR